MDEESRIRSVKEIYGSAKVDRSPIEINEIQVKNERLKADPPLKYKVGFNKKDLFYHLHGDFDIDLFAFSRDELIDMLQETIKDCWLEIANEDDSNLNSGARRQKKELLARFQRI